MDHTIVTHPRKTASKSNTLAYPFHISFLPVDGCSPNFEVILEGFHKFIEPVYGDQTKALNKIQDSRDRNCELMYNFKNPVGIVVYKNKLQNEYGLVDGLELKTLFLLNPEKNTRRGFGSCLFKRVEVVAREMQARLIYCTASSKVRESINCALKNGYKVDRVLEKNGIDTLYLLTKVLDDEQY